MSSIDPDELITSRRARLAERVRTFLGHSFLFLITCTSAAGVLLILFYITANALPFFRMEGAWALFGKADWYPTHSPPDFGALAIFVGTGLVTLGSCIIAVPLGVIGGVCLSDILPFWMRQIVKPVIELLACIPSVVYGFFALVIFAPFLQTHGGAVLTAGVWMVGGPVVILGGIVVSEVVCKLVGEEWQEYARPVAAGAMMMAGLYGLYILSTYALTVEITRGVNALNASIMLAIMALPTVVSVCEDAITAVGRDLRAGSYALGATRAETMIRIVIPAARGGILAAVILGVMRAVGETMTVLMAAGNAIEVPEPWYDYLEPVRTLTATIAIEMGEVDQTGGAAHYHALFALGFCLVVFSFACNLLSEWFMRKERERLGKE